MNWDTIKLKLEHILNAELRLEKLSEKEWLKYKQEVSAPKDAKSVNHNHEVLFYLGIEETFVYVFKVEAILITNSERLLVEMMIEVFRLQENKHNVFNGSDEKKVGDLQEWISRQLEKGAVHQELPESFASESALFSAKVPLLLYGDYSDNRKVGYQELKKLLESFFEVEMLLIPLLDKEWLILCSETLLEGDDEEKGFDESESTEDLLESICLGLYEMMVSEGIGECHISIQHPMIPAQSLLAAVVQLRESILLGRSYHIGNNIHLPWNLQLEKVLNLLPDHEKKKIAEYILKPNGYVMDSETQMTLEQFFALDCNVSETAKKLYIHRNTLLYRLDKFKQETNLDVRTFSDAVLVQISLLLYKVTKRK